MQERRQERRLRYHWPVWFKQDPANEQISHGQMVDINSQAASFTLLGWTEYIHQDQCILARFAVPRFSKDGSMDVAEFARYGRVIRVQCQSRGTRVVIRFDQPLPFRPGHQGQYIEDLVLV